MRRRLIVMFAVAVAAVTILAGCGEKKKEDPLSQITATETFPETEESTEAETAADEETTASELQPDSSADAEKTVFYHYEVFTDDEPHKVIFWTDGVTQKAAPFTSLKLPGWGIESISLSSDFVNPPDGKEIYVMGAEDDIDDDMRLAKERAIVDDSYGYPGAWSRRDEYDLFRVWRTEIDESFDFENAYPEDIFAKVYPFVDTGAFMIDLDQITKYRNPDGTMDYMIHCKNRGHWSNIKKKEDGGYKTVVTKMYEGYILVRPRGNVAHCIYYATTDGSWQEFCDYIFNSSAVYTEVDAITEGAVCKK